MKQFYVYIMRNLSGSLSTGVTNVLDRHFSACEDTGAEDLSHLVYFEVVSNGRRALARERQIKHWLMRENYIYLSPLQ